MCLSTAHSATVIVVPLWQMTVVFGCRLHHRLPRLLRPLPLLCSADALPLSFFSADDTDATPTTEASAPPATPLSASRRLLAPASRATSSSNCLGSIGPGPFQQVTVVGSLVPVIDRGDTPVCPYTPRSRHWMSHSAHTRAGRSAGPRCGKGESSESPRVISDHLGHRSGTFTFDVYAVVTAAWQRTASERVSRYPEGRASSQ
jgi:hypothetical protein